MGNWPFTFRHVLQKRLASPLDPCLASYEMRETGFTNTPSPAFLRDLIERESKEGKISRINFSIRPHYRSSNCFVQRPLPWINSRWTKLRSHQGVKEGVREWIDDAWKTRVSRAASIVVAHVTRNSEESRLASGKRRADFPEKRRLTRSSRY